MKRESGILMVESFSKPNIYYYVDLKAKTCTCPSFRFKGGKCKHIRKAEELEEMRRMIKDMVEAVFNE